MILWLDTAISLNIDQDRIVVIFSFESEDLGLAVDPLLDHVSQSSNVSDG